MTSKAAPRHPSPYVAGLLRPLRAAVLEAPGLLPPPAAAPSVAALVAGVAGDVTAAFDATLAGVLAGLQQMEASLQWLKKPGTAAGGSAGGGGAGPAAGPASDAEKIGLQLYLDVRAYGRELGGLGLGPVDAAVPAYAALAARVAAYAALAGQAGEP
jgi:hypothetical protein